VSTKAMKYLLADLATKAAEVIQRPAALSTVMHGFCHAMSVRRGRPIQLALRAFPDDIPVTGMRLDCGDRSIIVVEERAVPEAQLVILGHELWHEEKGECPNHIAGLRAAARALDADQAPDILRRAAEQILASQEVSRQALLTLAGRAESADKHEAEAETFGLLFGREVRAWTTGRHASSSVSPATVEGRINLSLSHRGGQILG
jgi:hypothetical protein